MSGTELCAVCNEQPHKYTCPRCKLKTCSAECAKAHKAASGCSGERNKAAYVPMNEYGWGTLMDDYTFLEDLGRKADEWGLEIARKGFLAHQQPQSARGGRGRGGAQQHRTAATRADGRRYYLKTQLDIRDTDLDLLPAGMARRKLNQSFWDSRAKTAMLTLELVFHPPRDTLALVTNPPPPITLLTHRNDFARPLGDLVRSSVSDHAKRKTKNGSPLPDWATGLVSAEEGSESVTLYLIADTSTTALPGKMKAFRKLDPALKLSKALRNTSFVEFPTIHLWDEDAFTGTLVDGPARADPDGPPPAKRRRVDASKGKTNMLALVGDYASGEDDDEGGEPDLADDTALDAMADYGSDQENEQQEEQEPDEGLDWREILDQAGVGDAAPDLSALLGVEDDADSDTGLWSGDSDVDVDGTEPGPSHIGKRKRE
ncbi:hypothetical protein AURDEDRAFT_53483 [Auricularia subglabra TFB-10046 SS5]|nr:hypothetical protein AURDEDRAFT_53483 [Auricularia subglabra TFB-10046 SS5]